MANNKVIFHIDMNCFFASCEIAKDPTLKGKKIAIAKKTLNNKGMVLTASYEAKRLGVKTTMLVFEALKVCKDLIIVEPHYDLYEEYSSKFFDYLFSITDIVEPASIDEGFIDVTDLTSGDGYLSLAQKIQADLLSLYNLPCSIGIGPNKFLAKMASDIKKPLGITILRKKDVERIMWPLPINDLFGAGKKTCEVLRNLGINYIGDIPNYKDKALLIKVIGQNSYDYLINCCMGNGSNFVDNQSYKDLSSISNSHTFDTDQYDATIIISLMLTLVDNISYRLIDKGLKSCCFTLQIKYNNFKMVSKSITTSNYTNSFSNMKRLFIDMFNTLYSGELPVRLVSVHASKLIKEAEEVKQLTLFDDFDKEEKDYEVNKVLKDINENIGKQIIKIGMKK